MSGQIFVVHGDITQIAADALVYSTSAGGYPGFLYRALCHHVPGFQEAYNQAANSAGISQGNHPLSPGEAFWVPLPHSGRPEDRQPRGVVVVGVIGKLDAKGEPISKVDISRRAVIKAIDMAIEKLTPAPGQRLLIAIPGLRMGAALGQRSREEEAWNERREAAQAQISAAREALVKYPSIDVVFTLYTQDLYHLYRDARCEVCGETRLTKEVGVPPLLAQAIKAGECVLFIGSGLSVDAGMPGWKKLIARLAKELNVQENAQRDTVDYYLDVAQLYRQERGEKNLTQVIQEAFGASVNPTLAHYLLMSLGVRHVITTNYDTLLEQTLTALRRDPVKVVQEEDIAKTGQSNTQFVIKFHGDATQVKNSLVLSRDDYDDFFYNHPAMAALIEGLLLNQTFFFVGYSLSDPNFRQIYSRISRILKEAKRTAYATNLDPIASSLTSRIWENKQLHLIDIPGDTLEKRSHHLLRFLDDLASTTQDEPKLFLAARAGSPEDSSSLLELNWTLKQIGAQVADASSKKSLSHDEVRQLASLVSFLTQHGWRPSIQHSAWQTWRQLAAHSENTPEQKCAMLREALRHTERWEDAEEIRAELEQ